MPKVKSLQIGDDIKITRVKRPGVIVDRYQDIVNNIIDYTLQLDDGTIISTSNTTYITFVDKDENYDKKGKRIIFTKPMQATVIGRFRNNNARAHDYLLLLKNGVCVTSARKYLC